MFKPIYNLFNKIFGGGTKGHTNIIPKTDLTWEQAVVWMKQGKKIKHHDSKGWYFDMDEDGVIWFHDSTGRKLYRGDGTEKIGNPWDVV